MYWTERTLSNQWLGHHFFWILRSEVGTESSGLKYPLILEAYLLGAAGHMKILGMYVDLYCGQLNQTDFA